MRSKQATLGKAELEVLKHVQQHAPVTVRQVAESFSELARTTVLTMMDRLRAKGYLTREKGERGVYRYRPAQGQTELLRGLVRQFVDTTLGGRVSPFLTYLVEEDHAELSDEEVETLRRLVRKLEGRGKET